MKAMRVVLIGCGLLRMEAAFERLRAEANSRGAIVLVVDDYPLKASRDELHLLSVDPGVALLHASSNLSLGDWTGKYFVTEEAPLLRCHFPAVRRLAGIPVQVSKPNADLAVTSRRMRRIPDT